MGCFLSRRTFVVNENIEGQVAGRIMRLGRITSANFHYVMFDNEYDYKIKSGQMWTV